MFFIDMLSEILSLTHIIINLVENDPLLRRVAIRIGVINFISGFPKCIVILNHIYHTNTMLKESLFLIDYPYCLLACLRLTILKKINCFSYLYILF